MRRAAALILFIGSICASVYAERALGNLLEISNNEVRHGKQYWTHDLGCLLLAVLLTAAFTFTARGRWRFAAAVPLLICAIVALTLIKLWPDAFA